ncbi:hypothetical protein ACQEVF_43825 [Nonomuraea polychroma]|uniref:hypothetical protein n=1 Tax=Nonomuraea polychroma TaxID=46176 RepID=UPI003D8B7A09
MMRSPLAGRVPATALVTLISAVSITVLAHAGSAGHDSDVLEGRFTSAWNPY